MTTALFSHPDSHAHRTPTGHPERVARLEAVEAGLAAPEFDGLLRLDPGLVSDDALTRCHPQRYVDRVAAAEPKSGWARMDADTHMTAGSYQAARRAAGAAVDAVDAVLDGRADNAFCAMRPPGHHAETETAMGFCLFGSVAIAAKHALAARGLSRIAIVDFDVHHGNGTQDLLWEEANAAFISTHQSPLFPGTGGVHERGADGQILNLPMPPGTDGPAYRRAFDAHVVPAVQAAKPELILVSAGYDAHENDPLASMELTTDDFAWIAGRLCDLAGDLCDGRLVCALEGGYDLDALAESVAATLRVMMGQTTEAGR